MGLELSCISLESEEETVNKILKEMFKKDTDAEVIYINFTKCIIYYPNLNRIKISKKLFSEFLECTLENNKYKEFYRDYFYSIIAKYNEIDNIRKIGLIIIENISKKEEYRLNNKLLIDHFEKFYLNDIIEISNKISPKKNIFSNFIISNKNIINESFLEELNPDYNIMESYDYVDLATVNNNKNKYLENVTVKKLNFYIKNEKLMKNFIKKKELQNLDNKIILLISDIIENNTNDLIFFLKNILSESRVDNLIKCWSLNNKKLLLFKMHMIYSSLAEKLFFSSTNAYNQNLTNKNIDYSKLNYDFIKYYITPKNNSSKNIKNGYITNKNNNINFDENKKEIIYFGLKSDKDSVNNDIHNNYEYDINKQNNNSSIPKIYKGKFHKELEQFSILKQRLISDFFHLTETQIKGDAIRNWLYDNSLNF